MDICIIGNSGGGISAVKTIRKYDPESTITLISKEQTSFYSPLVLPHYIEGRVSRSELFTLSPEFYRQMGVRLLLGKEVNALDGRRKAISLSDGGEISADSILIATGASPVLPEIEGVHSQGVFTLRTLADADRLLDHAPSRVVILGTGAVGIELSVALKRKGADVTLIGRSRVMSRLFTPAISEKIREILEENGVRVLLGQTIRGIYGDPVEGVRTEHEDVPCDAVIIALGTIPNTQFINADEIALSARGAVVVDEHLRTSLEDIYAAGECADSVDVLSGERGVNLTWPAAIEQGKIAAMNMIGRKRTYRGSLSLNVIHVFDVPVASVGDLEGEQVDRDYQGNLVQFIRQGERITAAQFVGYKDDSGIAQALVKNFRAQLEKWGSIEVSLTPYAMSPRWKMTGKGISNVVQVLRKEGE